MNNRLVVLYGKNEPHAEYIQVLKEVLSLEENVSVLDYINREIDFAEIYKNTSNSALFFSADIYGPVKELRPMMDEFWNHNEDVVALIHQPAYAEGPEDVFDEGISVECFQLSSRILSDADINDLFNLLQEQAKNRFRKSEEESVLSKLRERGYTITGLVNKDNFADFSVDAGYDYVKNKTYELLKDTICPFILKRRFEADNNLNDDLNRAIEYVKNNSDYDVDVMLDDVARTVNPLDSKRNLNLNYIIPSQLPLCDSLDDSIYAQTAVFAHIYYEDRVDNCLEYLANVPAKIGKYLTTSNPNTFEVLKRFIDNADDTWHLQMVRNHGRDISALWVVDAPILKKYKYVCYVHDKKTSGQKGNILNGDYYHYNVWENCLKNETYIKNVLYILSTRDKLGFLSPPFPIFFDYKGLLGNEWTICYEPTVQLAKDLGINANIDEAKPPFAFSNTFWAKTDALLPLINRQLKYEDFPGEPLPIDGSISHAIERIYIYCAQSQGYFSGIMEHDRYASMELNSMQKVMAARNLKLNKTRADLDWQWRRAEQLQKERDAYKSAIDSAACTIRNAKMQGERLNPNGKIYVYGCGKIGQRVVNSLRNQGYGVDGFLVSDGQPLQEYVMGIPCIFFSNASIANEDNVIIALNSANYEQVRELVAPIYNKVLYSELNV